MDCAGAGSVTTALAIVVGGETPSTVLMSSHTEYFDGSSMDRSW